MSSRLLTRFSVGGISRAKFNPLGRTMISVRKKLRYRNISWLMSSIDALVILERLGVVVTTVKDNEVWGFCPDHHLRVKDENGKPKLPSDPKWCMNLKTGDTYCYTEPKGSNLLYIVCRLRDCSPDDAVKWMLGDKTDLLGLELGRQKKLAELLRKKSEEKKQRTIKVQGLAAVAKEMAVLLPTQRVYDFFMRPPSKEATNIQPATVDHFKVFERTWGYYINRAIVPFFYRGELVSFCAIDLLGKKEWFKCHPNATESDYRKVRFPANFLSGSYLFGFNEALREAEVLVVVEGARERMKLWQEGLVNCVALNGCNLSDEQCGLITELCPKQIVVMLDGDLAGTRAARKIAEKLCRNFSVKIASLPFGKDPKVLDAKELRKNIEAAKIFGKRT